MNGKENGGSPSQKRETGRPARKIADATNPNQKLEMQPGCDTLALSKNVTAPSLLFGEKAERKELVSCRPLPSDNNHF